MTIENILGNNLKKTTAVIASIQFFSSISFAVLYSTLILFMTQKLKLSVPSATALMGTFGAFNYGLHILGGSFGGRFLSWRFLFVISVIFQAMGCLLLSFQTIPFLHIGVAVFLVGSGFNTTSINMMITQLFSPEDKQREKIFYWNYASMNGGLFIGYSLAGYFQLYHNFQMLFLTVGLLTIVSFIIVLMGWNLVRDRNTILSGNIDRREYYLRNCWGLCLVAILIPALYKILQYATVSNKVVVVLGIFIACMLFIFTLRQKEKIVRNKIFAYIIFILSALVFWTLYQLAPMGLTLFAQYNVDRHYMGLLIAPQWIQNINTVVIVVGGLFLSHVFQKLHQRGIPFSLSFKFSLALIFIGSGLLLLPIGIHFAAPTGLINFIWLLASYIFISLGELFMGPVGYAMIGQLSPQRMQGFLMGTWMLGIGVGATLSNYASVYAIHQTNTTNPLVTNAGYAHMFNVLGSCAVIVGCILFVCVPLLKKLTGEYLQLNKALEGKK